MGLEPETEARPLAHDMHLKAMVLQQATVRVPTGGDRFVHIALSGVGPVVGYETAELALESRESHWRRFAART